MSMEEDSNRGDLLVISDRGYCAASRLTRNSTIAQPDCVRNVNECPITLRASLDPWNANEAQECPLMDVLQHCLQLDEEKYPNTPRSQAITVSSNSDSDPGIATAHNGKDLYGDLSDGENLEALQRPTISLGDLKKAVDLESVLYRSDVDYDRPVESQHSTPTATTYRFEQPRPVWHFFNAVTSNDIYDHTEDWGIDRSIYTRYSRSGFFADCHIADALHHGDYLDEKECEGFAEIRSSLVVCIISASRDMRVNEVQRGIIPLAVNLMDRFIVKQKHRLSTILDIRNLHVDLECVSDVVFSESMKVNKTNDISEPAGILTSNHAEEQNSYGTLDKVSLESVINGENKHNKGCKRSVDNGNHGSDYCLATESNYDVEAKEDSASECEDNGTHIDQEIVYNFIAAACYFIADRYNGLTNTSLNLLLDKWAGTCYQFTKTKRAAMYISNHRSAAMNAITMFMLKVTLVLEYRLTVPFPCHMAEELLISTPDFKFSQNPSNHSLYQKLAAIMSRISYVDDAFHKFKPSIVTLSIYSLIRRLAIHDQAVKDENAWLLVDDSDSEIKSCSELMANTLLQFLDTDMLDVIAQPVFMKQQREELFSHLFDDWGDIETRKLIDIGNILLKFCV